MNARDVGEIVCSEFDEFIENNPSTAKWNDLRERLRQRLLPVDERLAFDGLLWVIENSLLYQHHVLAGELLLALRVQMFIRPSEFLRRIAPRLNASASSVVHYLADRLGKEAALREVHALQSQMSDSEFLSGLDKFRYFLGEHTGMA